MSDARNTAKLGVDADTDRIHQRLRALRSRYPGMALSTRLTHIHDDQVVVRARLSLPDGSSVSAHAAEPSDGAGMLDGAIELAEQRAMTRVLDLLGLGDVPAGQDRAEPRPAPIPRAEDENAPPVVDALRKASQRRQAAERPPVTAGEPTAESVGLPSSTAADPSDSATLRSGQALGSNGAAREGSDSGSSRPEPEPEVRPTPAPPPRPEPADEPDMADYTWTHFWTWARANDLSTKGQVEQRIGRPIDNLTPRDVRQLLHDQGVPE